MTVTIMPSRGWAAVRARWGLWVLALALASLPSLAAATGFDSAAADRAVLNYLRLSGTPGAVAVVTDGVSVVWRGGFGTDGKGQPLTPATRAPICSVSKSFVALAVMQEVEAGKLALDAPVVTYLPDFRLADPGGSQITIRQLLTHRSGLSDRGFREKSIKPTPRSLEEAVAALHLARLSSDPGTRRSYTNPNYWVAARLIEVVSGEPFDDYMRTRIFQPLGMTASSTWNAASDAPDIPNGHVRVLGHGFPAAEPPWFLGGACGVVTTADDMGRWLEMQITGRSPLTGQPMVSPAALDAMHHGLGWNMREEGGLRLISHNGIMFTYSANEVLLPDVGQGMGIAVIATAGAGLSPLPADELAGMLIDIAQGRPARQPAPAGLIIDAVLGLAALASLVLAVRRWRRPASRQTGWRMGIGLLVAAIPMVLMGYYPAVLRGALGRDLNWAQSLYATPMLFVLVTVLAAIGVGSLLHRLRAD